MLSQDDIEKIFKEVDKNHDNVIDYPEFKKLILNIIGSKNKSTHQTTSEETDWLWSIHVLLKNIFILFS